MRCKDARLLLTERIDGVLSEDMGKRLDAHLKDCRGCENSSRELLRVYNTMKAAYRFSASPGFSSRVMERLQTENLTGDVFAGNSILSRFHSAGLEFLRLAETAAVISAVAAGIFFGWFLSDRYITMRGATRAETSPVTVALSYLDYLDPVPPESLAVAYFEMEEGGNER